MTPAPRTKIVFTLAAVSILLIVGLIVSGRTYFSHADHFEGVHWDLLVKGEDFYVTVDKQYVPRFYPKEVKALADTNVSITGYMISLQAHSKISKFLLVPRPPSCPFCISAGPNETIEVSLAEPSAYVSGVIQVGGVFKLKDGALDTGILYAMDDARILN